MTRVDALERDGDERDMEESTPFGLRSTIDVSRYKFHALFLSGDFFRYFTDEEPTCYLLIFTLIDIYIDILYVHGRSFVSFGKKF